MQLRTSFETMASQMSEGAQAAPGAVRIANSLEGIINLAMEKMAGPDKNKSFSRIFLDLCQQADYGKVVAAEYQASSDKEFYLANIMQLIGIELETEMKELKSYVSSATIKEEVLHSYIIKAIKEVAPMVLSSDEKTPITVLMESTLEKEETKEPTPRDILLSFYEALQEGRESVSKIKDDLLLKLAEPGFLPHAAGNFYRSPESLEKIPYLFELLDIDQIYPITLTILHRIYTAIIGKSAEENIKKLNTLYWELDSEQKNLNLSASQKEILVAQAAYLFEETELSLNTANEDLNPKGGRVYEKIHSDDFLLAYNNVKNLFIPNQPYRPEQKTYYKVFVDRFRKASENDHQACYETLNFPHIYAYLFASKDFDPNEFEEILIRLGRHDVALVMDHYVRLDHFLKFEGEVSIKKFKKLNKYFNERFSQFQLSSFAYLVFKEMYETFQNKMVSINPDIFQFLIDIRREKLNSIFELAELEHHEMQTNSGVYLKKLLNWWHQHSTLSEDKASGSADNTSGAEDEALLRPFKNAFMRFFNSERAVMIADLIPFEQTKKEILELFTTLHIPMALYDYLQICNHLHQFKQNLTNYMLLSFQDNNAEKVKEDQHVNLEAYEKTIQFNLDEIQRLLANFTLNETNENSKMALSRLIDSIENMIEFSLRQPPFIQTFQNLVNSMKPFLQTNKRDLSTMLLTDEKKEKGEMKEEGKGKEKVKEEEEEKKGPLTKRRRTDAKPSESKNSLFKPKEESDSASSFLCPDSPKTGPGLNGNPK